MRRVLASAGRVVVVDQRPHGTDSDAELREKGDAIAALLEGAGCERVSMALSRARKAPTLGVLAHAPAAPAARQAGGPVRCAPRPGRGPSATD